MELKIRKGLDTFLSVTCIAILAAILISISVGVVTRYILNDPAGWTEELSRYLLVWLTLLGAPLGCLNSAHIGLSFFPNALSAKGKLMWSRLTSLTLVLFCVLMFAQGIRLTSVYWKSKSVTMGMSIGFVYISLCVSAVLIVFAETLNIIHGWKTRE